MDKKNISSLIERRAQEFIDLAEKIWERPEVALEEVYASSLQMEYLAANGFRVRNVNGLSTAFTAEFGNGKPVIGLLGEYDALPGLSQKVTAQREPIAADDPGHGCGHNLIGVGCIAAAIAIKELIEKGLLNGTIKYFGCPAEERFGGKRLMLNANAFDGVDCCFSWHPESVNKITKETFRAIYDVSYRFRGTTSYIAADREMGGNAVSAMELLNIGVQYLRAHLNDDYIIEYCVTKGAETSNVLPEITEISYALRADNTDQCKKLVERIGKIAEGAALMSGTTVKPEITGEYYSELYNEVLGDIVYRNMVEVPRPEYTPEEMEFADTLAETIGKFPVDRTKSYYGIVETQGSMHRGVAKQDRISYKPASDVGNVSWQIPTAMFFVATNPIGMPMHTWQATATSGSSLGYKGMLYASKVMAASIFELMEHPEKVEAAKKAFNENFADRK